MGEQKPTWVAKQADCNIDTVFDALVKAMQQDVDARNKLPAKKRNERKHVFKWSKRLGPYTFSCTDEDGNPIVSDYEGEETAVSLRKDARDQRIRILYTWTQIGGTCQYVTLRWNAEKQDCELILDGDEDRPLEVRQVSKEALGQLFSHTGQ